MENTVLNDIRAWERKEIVVDHENGKVTFKEGKGTIRCIRY